ncbi:hypothetical protein AMTR_s00081p00179950 [Amborella trichopoda]|uniref:Uncharacterized protein n=1 Tax=Amborella trichopoda TaxID=13333 RepID=W1PBZ1_AMBTC|nr:hypothetical protein AMTR_s00081p00179950 [Amborella trichopoda]
MLPPAPKKEFLSKIMPSTPPLAQGEHVGGPSGLSAGGVETSSIPEGSPSNSRLKLNGLKLDLSGKTHQIQALCSELEWKP